MSSTPSTTTAQPDADDSGEMKPSNKGVNLKIDRLPQIAEAINEGLAEAKAGGLLT